MEEEGGGGAGDGGGDRGEIADKVNWGLHEFSASSMCVDNRGTLHPTPLSYTIFHRAHIMLLTPKLQTPSPQPQTLNP